MYQNVYYESRKNKVHIWDDKSGHVVVPYKRYAYVKDNYGTHVSLYGDRLKKIYKWDKSVTGLHESDISPENEADDHTIMKTVEMLKEGKIVGWYQGNGEVGPRALGNRSILYNPADKNAKN